jgi:subtilisin family serine protease
VGLSSSTYVYTPYVDPTYPDFNKDGYSDRTVDNDHGAHVAGTAVGNSLGWARDANIYNLNPYPSNQNTSSLRISVFNHLDYLKNWHQNKSANPITGIKNPTISNHSYGVTYATSITNITTVTYRGVVYSGPFTSTQLNNFGIYNTASVAYATSRNAAVEADLTDLVAAGIIPVVAAGNTYSRSEPFSLTTTSDYYNYLQIPEGPQIHYSRGSIGAVEGVICVGAVDALSNETKADFSNCGPRIDVYAPGRNIMSVVNSTLFTFSNDPRNTSYYLSKKSGTSMACPQVAGVIACLAETWPTVKASQAIEYIHQTSKTDQLVDGTGGPADYTDLQDSANRYLYFAKQRPVAGQVGPKSNLGIRPSNGMLYPRPKIFRYGR